MSFWAAIGWGLVLWLAFAALCVWCWSRMPRGGE